jgi:hypothetical protein
MLTRSTLNLISLIGMIVTAFLATALLVRDVTPHSSGAEAPVSGRP